jgi:hypothetical protein
LAKERRLLITRDASERHFVTIQVCRQIAGRSRRGGDDLRQACMRDPKELQQYRVPLAASNIEEQGAACVRGIGHMALATGQAPRKPAVDRSKGKLATVGALASSGDMLEEPGEFGGRKVRIE